MDTLPAGDCRTKASQRQALQFGNRAPVGTCLRMIVRSATESRCKTAPPKKCQVILEEVLSKIDILCYNDKRDQLQAASPSRHFSIRLAICPADLQARCLRVSDQKQRCNPCAKHQATAHAKMLRGSSARRAECQDLVEGFRLSY